MSEMLYSEADIEGKISAKLSDCYTYKELRAHMLRLSAEYEAELRRVRAELEDVPDGVYEREFTLETPPGCRQAVVTRCGDTWGIIKGYLWIPSDMRIVRQRNTKPKGENDEQSNSGGGACA